MISNPPGFAKEDGPMKSVGMSGNIEKYGPATVTVAPGASDSTGNGSSTADVDPGTKIPTSHPYN
jgi:hypothetical protein